MEGQAGADGGNQVTRVFDRYGARDKNARNLSDMIAAAA